MATGTPGTNGVWQYGEDDSEATFSALLNKAASTTDTQIGLDRARLTALEAAGRIVQVVSATKTNTASTNSSTFSDISGLSVSITPKSATNKILVLTRVNVGVSGDQLGKVKLLRGTTDIDLVAFSRFNDTGWVLNYASNHLDSPATTSATTYKLQWNAAFGTANLYLNRRGFDDVAATYSSITVLEVAA